MKPESSTLISPVNLNHPERRVLPDNRDLSLSILPMEIRRMDSGLDGLASHSGPQNVSKQQRRISHDRLDLYPYRPANLSV